MVPDQIDILIVQSLPHFLRVFLIYTKDDCLGKAVSLLEVACQMPSNGLGAGFKSNDPLKLLGAVYSGGYPPPVRAQFALAGAPAGRVDRGDDSMDSIGSEKAVLDALAKAVGVERVTKVTVRVTIIFSERGSCHTNLADRVEILEDLAPVALIGSAPPMALIHDDQVKEVWRIIPVQTGATLVFSDGLVDSEVHLPSLHGIALDLPPSVPEGGEDLVLWVIDQDIPIG